MSTSISSVVNEIKIKFRNEQIQTYAGVDWRKAFNRYIDGVWSQHNQFAEGVLIIDTVILSLHNEEYSIQNPTDLIIYARPGFNRSEIHAVPSDRNSIELGLAKFVRNDFIRMLVIEFSCSRLMLWKDQARTVLHSTLIDRSF